METTVHYSLSDKQLCFRLRERISTKPGLELKCNGLLNTVTGTVDYRAALQKTMTVGPSPLAGQAETPLVLGGGVALTSASRDRPLLTASARKHFSLLDGQNTVLAVRAIVDVDPNTRQATPQARVRLHQKFPGFSKQQDLRLTVGMDLDCVKFSEPKPELYLQVRENNWALHYQRRALRLSYDL